MRLPVNFFLSFGFYPEDSIGLLGRRTLFCFFSCVGFFPFLRKSSVKRAEIVSVVFFLSIFFHRAENRFPASLLVFFIAFIFPSLEAF